MLNNKTILLIISGGIAAYKSLELIRLLKKDGAKVRCILTQGGAQFVTPLSVSALSENPVYTDLWSLKNESEMGHIRLSREADMIVIAPASANMIARMAHGMADDLASTTLLAADKPAMIFPAMNPMMWQNPATKDNIALLQKRGHTVVMPDSGEMACGEIGQGRLPEATAMKAAIENALSHGKPLAGKRAVITAGPTFEPIDPVRFIGNRSSGTQGFALAAALADLGADVTLIAGPNSLPNPQNIKTIRIETAQDMLKIASSSMPCDIFAATAAVADYRPAFPSDSKIKKTGDAGYQLDLIQNPDILKTIGTASTGRPPLVIGFAAETEGLLDNAKAKRARKGCDWLVANLVSEDNPAFGSGENQVYFLTSDTVEEWPKQAKDQIARTLADKIVTYYQEQEISAAAE